MSSIIEINQFNVNTGIVKKQRDELHSNTKWHKIIVENVEKLIHYQPSNNTASFLLKNCGAAIERMCNQNLIIKNPFNFDKPFKIAIQLSTANTENFKVNIQDNVTEILNRRYNKQTGVLNLENFVNDSNLEEFCPLSQPKLLFYILHISKTIPFKHLKLCNNEIESLKPMEALVGINTLISIDLRNNSIPSMAEIIHMQDFHLRELWLDGNPLCDKFDEFTYGRDAKRYLNTLEKLDGVNIQQKGFLPFRRNFLCSQTGYDLVDQFLEHYFTLYDAQNRSVLDGLYHKEAQFSLTSNYLSLQSTSIHARLRAYNKISRNILQMQDSNKIDEFLFAGPYDIIKLLSSLPPSEHDPFSFTVDLITYTEKLAILVVSGVFREIKETLFEVERLLNFTRTFVLLAGADREYTILNEMVHISNATTTQASTAFQLVKPLRSDRIHIPQPKDAKEMLQIVETVKILTGMNMEWSKKCLEECNYNLERALTLFVELYKMDKMPDTAFNSSADSFSNEADLTATSLKAILNEPHEFSKPEEPNQPTIVHPILGKIQPSNVHLPTASTSRNTTEFVPPIRGNVAKQIPSRLTTSKSVVSNAHSIPITRNIQPVNLPLVPHLGNLQSLGLRMPGIRSLQPMLNAFRPVIHPMIPHRSIITPSIQEILNAKPKTASRHLAIVKTPLHPKKSAFGTFYGLVKLLVHISSTT
ncbi:hypothetical protein Trydic_g7490 [Trypoxylus dichotomus]